jgi:hydroxylamine dehydrogenase
LNKTKRMRMFQAVIFTGAVLARFGDVMAGGPQGLPTISTVSAECIKCHKDTDRGIFEQWGESRHFRANVGCFECHQAAQGESDAFEHFGQYIATIVSPKDCKQCHEKEASEFSASHHSKAGRILGSLDNRLAEVVEGNNGFVTEAFPQGVSAAAVSGCWQCHGTVVKVLDEGKLDPATWPNTGIGRINPDGSEGSCSACHARHAFSAEQARHPDNCGKCHMGPDHPQKEIYYESKHGIAYLAHKDKLRMDRPKWVVGEDYVLAPTCATCHMSATPDQPVTHDVGMRISWNNRPAKSIRPEAADAKMGLAGKDVPWEKRRDNMKNVCLNCHNNQWVDNFYSQYDALLDLYHKKFADPGIALMALAKPLLRPAEFSNKLDFVWYELWHHEGRRARMGVSMMGPDYTHWHGTYEVAKHFYAEFVPELEELIHKGLDSKDPEKVKAANALNAKLREVLDSSDHRWYDNKMDPVEIERRKKAAEEFNARYKE